MQRELKEIRNYSKDNKNTIAELKLILLTRQSKIHKIKNQINDMEVIYINKLKNR